MNHMIIILWVFLKKNVWDFCCNPPSNRYPPDTGYWISVLTSGEKAVMAFWPSGIAAWGWWGQEKWRRRENNKARLYPRWLQFLKPTLKIAWDWFVLACAQVVWCSVICNYWTSIMYFQQGPRCRKSWLRVLAKLAPCVLGIILTFTVTTHSIVYPYI